MTDRPTCCDKPMKVHDHRNGKTRYKCTKCQTTKTAGNEQNQEDKAERAAFERALAESIGNKTQAAKLLKMRSAEFKKKLELYHIEGFYRQPPKSKIYVVTSAQNVTPVHDGFLRSMQQYRDFNDAEIVIIPLRYKNPTSLWGKERFNQSWSSELRPYLCDSRFDIGQHLTVMADIKTQPTAVNPLSGFESISRGRSAIFGHTKLALTTVPVVAGSFPKIIATTGAVTLNNYTDTKTGKKGDFHHAYAAQIIEVSGDKFHIRQINATHDGSFIDLNYEYTPDGVYYAPRAAGIVLGDWHDHMTDESVIAATFTNENSIVNTLDPEQIVWHDALDFYSRNHHHEKNPFVKIAKHRGGCENVRDEIEHMFNRIEALAGNRFSVFPYSNHPDALARWIKDADWKLDPINAEFYLETAYEMVKSTRMTGHKSHTIDPFKYWGQKMLNRPEMFKFLGASDGYCIKDIAVDMHGHLGANGSRGGNVKAFSKLAVKNITAHGHGPGINDGAYRVGTSSRLDAEYVAGPSNWLHTHCPIYANGKRSLISIIGGEWCG
jgi:hypothetical protein